MNKTLCLNFFFSLEIFKNEKSLIYYFLTKDIKIDISAIMGCKRTRERVPFSLTPHLLDFTKIRLSKF